jgi:hypothetical protein
VVAVRSDRGQMVGKRECAGVEVKQMERKENEYVGLSE